MKINKAALSDRWFPLASCLCALSVSFMAFQNFSFTLVDDSALFFQSEVDGRVGYWAMDGNVLKHAGVLTDKALLSSWRLASVADLNADGYQDLVFQHDSDGKVMYWLMHGTTRLSEHVMTQDAGEQQLVAVADLDRDGFLDFIFQDPNSGQVSFWLMNSSGIVSAGNVPNAGGNLLPDTRLAVVADMNGDGYPDFVWQKRSTGAVQYWLMRGLKLYSAGDLSPDAMPGARLSAALDLNQDGNKDLVFLNNADHSTVAWLMDGVNRLSSTMVNNSSASVGAEWRLVAGSDK